MKSIWYSLILVNFCWLNFPEAADSHRQKLELTPTVFTRISIKAGTRFTLKMLKVVQCKVLQGAVHDTNQVLGQTATSDLDANVVVFTHNVAGLAKGGKADPELKK